MRILFLDLDTLRPDHLGCYGYPRPTSPNLDALASRGIRFDRYYCSDAPCLPSRAALFTGRPGIHTGVVGHGGTAADLRLVGRNRGFADRCRTDNLPARLASAGYRTVTVSPFAERHGAWWFYAGFREMFNPGKGGLESAEDVTPFALDWLKRNARSDKWLLHVNYWDPHTPYRAPADFGNPFQDMPIPRWLTEDVLRRHQQAVGPHTALEINMWDDTPLPQWPRYVPAVRTMADLRRHIDGYDCGIAYMDRHIGMLLDELDRQGVLEETAIVVTADHGENQGELGIYAEHATADEPTCRIPLIIVWPGAPCGVDRALRCNLDLAPTLTELAGAQAAPTWEGRSFAALFRGGADPGREYVILSQCAHVCQRSVRTASHLYIRTYHDGFHLFPDEMLFAIEDDPHEQTDIAPQSEAVRNAHLAVLEKWHADMMSTMPDGYAEDPMRTVLREGGPYHARGQLERYCRRLYETDRGWAVPLLWAKHAADPSVAGKPCPQPPATPERDAASPPSTGTPAPEGAQQ